jgi:osmotically-inducible protein OsmY
MKEERRLDRRACRVLILILLFAATILFLSQEISSAEEGMKGSVKEGVKETAGAISDTTKDIADEVRKKKKMVVDEIKEGWFSVKKSAKGAYGSTKEESTETAITAKVKAKLLASKKRNAFDEIDVSTEGRTVNLSGFVNTAKDAADAIEIALGVKGVEKVISKIEVSEECH